MNFLTRSQFVYCTISIAAIVHVLGCNEVPSADSRAPTIADRRVCEDNKWAAYVIEDGGTVSVVIASGPSQSWDKGFAIYNVREAGGNVQVEWKSCDFLLIKTKKAVYPYMVRLRAVKYFDIEILYEDGE